MNRRRWCAVALSLGVVALVGSGLMSMIAIPSVAADQGQNPAVQRAEMIRILGAIDQRLKGIGGTLQKVLDRLPEGDGR